MGRTEGLSRVSDSQASILTIEELSLLREHHTTYMNAYALTVECASKLYVFNTLGGQVH